jgi:hypothetical protein
VQFLVGGLIVLLMLYGLAAQFFRNNPGSGRAITVTLTIACFVGLYFAITRAIFRSDRWRSYTWKLALENGQRKQTEEVNKQLAEYQERLAEWEQSPLPSGEDFAAALSVHAPPMHFQTSFKIRYELQRAYELAIFDKSVISPEWGRRLYHRLLEASIAGMKEFAEKLPSALKEDHRASLFTTAYTPTEEQLRPAYAALANHFRDEEFRRANLFHNTLPPDPAPRAKWSDFEDIEDREKAQRQYDKVLAANEKARDKQWQEQSPLQQAVWGTPLYPFAPEALLPEPIEAPFDIDPLKWFETTWVIAAQGRGKSNLLRHLVLAHIEDACVIILDAKGDLLQTFKRHAPIKDRLVILDPSAEHPLAINPLDIGHSNEFLRYVFELLNTGMSTNHGTLVYYTALLCQQIDGASLATFRSILERGWKQYAKEVAQLDPDDQTFFHLQWDDTLYKPRRPEILARLRAMTASPAMRPMLHCPKTQLDLAKLMDEKKIVLIDNNYEKLEDAGAELLGRLVIGMVWAAARKRSLHHGHKTKVLFVIDEAHWVIARDTKIPTIIQQTRSQKIAMIVAHQELQSIENPDVKASLFNAAIKFGNPTGEAAMLAEKFDTDAQVLKQQRLGTFAAWVLDKTNNGAVTVKVPQLAGPDNMLFNYPHLTDEEYREVLQRSRDAYCYRAPAPEPKPAPNLQLVPSDQPPAPPPASPQPRKKGR